VSLTAAVDRALLDVRSQGIHQPRSVNRKCDKRTILI